MTGVGIVIVTYNSAEEIGGCLDAAVPTGARIVVVDNASTDGSVAEISRRPVHLIANSSNRGFAAAVNQGFAALDCPYILLLNPDAAIQFGVEELRRACDLPRAAGAGGTLIARNGQPQAGFMVRRLPTPAALILESLLLNRIWPNNPINRRYRALDMDLGATIAVEQPAGAFLMIRREVWAELNGFDERFAPLWFEDVDFCRRAVDCNYLLYFVPEAVAKHTGGHSIPQLSVELRRFYWYRSLLRYTAKHFSPTAFRLNCVAVILGCVLRTLGDAFSRSSVRPLAANGKVLRLACRQLFAIRQA